MREMSKSQQRRFRVHKDPKHKAMRTKRHKDATKYDRNKVNSKDTAHETDI